MLLIQEVLWLRHKPSKSCQEYHSKMKASEGYSNYKESSMNLLMN